MKLKYILQSEKSQYEKATYYMVPIIRSSRKKKNYTNDKMISGYQRFGTKERGMNR